MADGLTQGQLADITRNLEAQRKELLETIREQIKDSGDQQRFDRWTQLNDPGDYSVADVMRDMQLEQLDRETEQLREIEGAEVRIQKGEYGQCIDCGTDINPERLMAQPTAKRCTECQERYERMHSVGHSSSSL